MKNSKFYRDLLILFLVVLIVNLSPMYVSYILFPFALLVFLFHFMVRKKHSYKNFFLSKWNIFTSKHQEAKTISIAPDLVFNKLLEVLEKSDFKIITKNETTFEIFVTTRTSFTSWGENIYISINNKNNESNMIIESTTFFGALDWNKNQNNFNTLISNFEESLTI